MHVLTTPLNSLEREAARSAANAAMRSKTLMGIRPKTLVPKTKSAGIKIAGFGDVDAAIAAAREAWPTAKTFSVFGAKSFKQFGGPGVILTSDDYKANTGWMVDAGDGLPNPGDGCFDDAEDFGEFNCDPATTMNIGAEGGDASQNEPNSGMESLETPPEGQ